MKKYFICSDIHSDYNALMNAIKENGFDINNDNHILVVAGDIFDRGEDSVKVYEYLKNLTDINRAIVLAGNHHEMFIDFLEHNNMYLCAFNYRNNGLRATVEDFLHQTAPWEMYIMFHFDEETQRKTTNDEWNKAWCDFVRTSAQEINEEYPDLLPWLKNLPDYLELKHNVITHGMIDGYAVDWHYPTKGWKDCHWAKPVDAAFLKNVTGKHIYLGHIDSDTIRDTFHLPKDNYSLYTRPEGDVTYLDSCTILTHHLNMVVVEDEEEIC